MGTRNLTAVMSDGEYKIAQYGQWDGYPSGQGVTALAFCREHLSTHEGREKFKKKLELVRFCSDEEIEGFYKSIGVSTDSGWLTCDQADAFSAKYPYFSRDHSAEIFGYVFKAPEYVPRRVPVVKGTWHTEEWQLVKADKDEQVEVLMQEAIDFVEETGCEWAYVIDLDKGTFEVYMGYNKEPLAADERFASFNGERDGCYPVRLLKKFHLQRLPTKERFLNVLQSLEDERE